jgi:uroporphyrinogen decarboxylase
MTHIGSPFSVEVTPDWEALLRCLRREGTPRRVHAIELLIDDEVQVAVAERFGLARDLDSDDPFHALKREVRVMRFLGYDYVRSSVDDVGVKIDRLAADDTAELRRAGGREFVNEHRGPITSWEEFEAFPWPDPEKLTTRRLAWLQENLPDDMCIIGSRGFGHFAEYLTWLMGYETLCYALYDNRDLVAAISRRLIELYKAAIARTLEFDQVKVVWASDDMGFRSGTLIRPDDLRQFVLPGHRAMAEAAHAAGCPYLLHSCGKLDAIMDDLLDDVRIDGLHSFEDTIKTAEATKATYGHRIAVLGGIDVDFLCRADEAAIRRRTRSTLERCFEDTLSDKRGFLGAPSSHGGCNQPVRIRTVASIITAAITSAPNPRQCRKTCWSISTRQLSLSAYLSMSTQTLPHVANREKSRGLTTPNSPVAPTRASAGSTTHFPAYPSWAERPDNTPAAAIAITPRSRL